MTSEATLRPQLGISIKNSSIVKEFSIGKPSSLFYNQLNASKNPTYTFINFQQKVPPIRLFPPILLLVFKEISHLYFYSEPSSIQNSRVHNKFHYGSL